MTGSTDERYELKRTFGRIAWFVAVAIVLLAGVALATGRPFSLGVGGDTGPRLHVQEGRIGPVVERDELAANQPDIMDEVDAAVEDLGSMPGADVDAPVDISGSWRSLIGLSYEITQLGSAATIVERDATGYITAYGQGSVSGRTFAFTYATAAYTTGTGTLTLSPDGSTLVGGFSDALGQRGTQLFR